MNPWGHKSYTMQDEIMERIKRILSNTPCDGRSLSEYAHV